MLKLNSPGLYLLGKGKTVQVATDDFLIILFHSPSSDSSALMLEKSDEHREDFLTKLQEMFTKYSQLADVDPALIKVKIFGAKPQYTSLMSILRKWLAKNEIPIVASDFGKNLRGLATIDCSAGKIGIQCSFERTEGASLLSTGTAKGRHHSSRTTATMIVLSHSSVTRILAKQSIEEEPSWQAHCPTDLSRVGLTQALNRKNFSALILADDIAKNETVRDLIIETQSENPDVVFAWIGSSLPDWATPNMKLLPPLEPFLIPRFKKMLKQSLADILFSKTSQTLSFPRKRKA